MSNTIYGTPVGTPISPKKIEEVLNPVKTVNGQAPDERGNVEVSSNGLTSGQIAALDNLFRIAAFTKDATAEYAAFCEAFYSEPTPDEPEDGLLRYAIRSLNNSDGSFTESTQRATTEFIPFSDGGAITIAGYKFILHAYDANKKHTGIIIANEGSPWFVSGSNPNRTSPYVRVLLCEENFSGDMTIEQGQLDGLTMTVGEVNYTLIGGL